MAEFTITKFERLEAEADQTAFALGGMTIAGRKAGVAASVEAEADNGRKISVGVSKLDGEEEWIVDFFAVEGEGIGWANGQGARYCKLKALTDAEIVAALDARAAEGAVA